MAGFEHIHIDANVGIEKILLVKSAFSGCRDANEDDCFHERDYTIEDSEQFLKSVKETKMNLDYFQLLFEYNAWANSRVWNCVMELNEEQFKREFQFSWRSVQGELVHHMWAEWLYLQRITGQPANSRFQPEDFPTRKSIQTRWQQIEADWKTYLSSIKNGDLSALISYHDLGGNPHTNILWQILAHVINHSTTHRVTTLAMIDLMGCKTVDQDLIYYMREKAS